LIPLGLLFDFLYVTLYFLVAFPTGTFLHLSAERILLLILVRRLRKRGRNLCNVVVIGSAKAARDADLLARRDGLGYQWSLTLDMKILAKALPAIISRQGMH